MGEVLEINGLSDASALSLGQVIEVPRPTPTEDPNAIPDEATEVTEGEASSSGFTVSRSTTASRASS